MRLLLGIRPDHCRKVQKRICYHMTEFHEESRSYTKIYVNNFAGGVGKFCNFLTCALSSEWISGQWQPACTASSHFGMCNIHKQQNLTSIENKGQLSAGKWRTTKRKLATLGGIIPLSTLCKLQAVVKAFFVKSTLLHCMVSRWAEETVFVMTHFTFHFETHNSQFNNRLGLTRSSICLSRQLEQFNKKPMYP